MILMYTIPRGLEVCHKTRQTNDNMAIMLGGRVGRDSKRDTVLIYCQSLSFSSKTFLLFVPLIAP